jgi:hypothetical protein
LIEGNAERLLLDFVIQQGRPVEMEETDSTVPVENVKPADQREQPAATLLESDASPLPTETGVSPTAANQSVRTGQHRTPTFAERVGQASFISHGGVVLTAAALGKAPRASRQASVDRLLARFGRGRLTKSTFRIVHPAP